MSVETVIPSIPPPRSVPPLSNGDRLSRAEFERRWEAMPKLKRAELLEGIVYMPSPLGHERHGKPHFDVAWWLGIYRAATPGVEGGQESSLRLDDENEPQPDAFLRVLPSHGGRAGVDDAGFLTGAPELIVEVAATGASYDLHVKLDVYRRHGVREYILWRTIDREIDWFILRDGRYDRLPAVDGVFRSQVFPGLWLASAAMISGDVATVEQVLHRGLADPAHTVFAERLRAAAGGRA
jgi:Uma2 family endonuclease